MKRPRIAPLCNCGVYRFPHRPGSGKLCKGTKDEEKMVLRKCEPKCSRNVHRPDCRPGRPLCRWRRREATGNRGLCTCDAYHHTHRWGSALCAGGAPDPVKMYAAMDRKVRKLG